MAHDAHGQEMETLLLREYLLSPLTILLFVFMFQSSAPTTKRAQSEQQSKNTKRYSNICIKQTHV